MNGVSHVVGPVHDLLLDWQGIDAFGTTFEEPLQRLRVGSVGTPLLAVLLLLRAKPRVLGGGEQRSTRQMQTRLLPVPVRRQTSQHPQILGVALEAVPDLRCRWEFLLGLPGSGDFGRVLPLPPRLHRLVEGFLARCPKGGVSDVMGEARCFDQRRIDECALRRQASGQSPADLGDLQRVGESVVLETEFAEPATTWVFWPRARNALL